MIKEAIGKLVLKESLTAGEMEEVMKEMLGKRASGAQIASFLTALRMRGEAPEEIAEAAKVIKEKSLKMNFGENAVCLDREEITVERETILSTAKDFSGETAIFNISTATALVVAGGGLKVAKYVKRPAPPLCGCADVIEALGVHLDMTPSQLERCFKTLGICFLHDHLVHNGLDHLITLRKKIGIRTLFNLLDPLINPGGATVQVLGVYDPNLTETMATVLMNLGIKRGLVIHGKDTLDEISITGETKVTELKDGEIKSYTIGPEDFGMKRRKVEEIKGGTKEENAEIILKILKGDEGAKRDIIALNAAAAFVVAGRVKDFKEGIDLAEQTIDSGKALDILNRLVQFTNSEHRFIRGELAAEMV
ncbi:MAG: anthranilate phosphoribosyltransferase [Thermodesulfobacteriota bacterium]|nr:anthranilate phosphoribosyltransferase [Thermodesulfobacteriota bacterium]